MTKPKIYTVAHPEDLSPPLANQGFCVDVVLASDYAALEQELTSARRQIEVLAAENVGLAAENKKAVDAVTVFSNVTHDIIEIICDELGHDRVAEIVAAYNDLGNMPATDRLVAGIKADGVALTKSAFEKHIQSTSCYQDEMVGMESALSIACQVESQLREGAK